MLDTPWQKKAAAVRRENRKMTAAGYRKHETDWEIHRGAAFGQEILDVKISADGKHVWTKVGYVSGGPDEWVTAIWRTVADAALDAPANPPPNPSRETTG